MQTDEKKRPKSICGNYCYGQKQIKDKRMMKLYCVIITMQQFNSIAVAVEDLVQNKCN